MIIRKTGYFTKNKPANTIKKLFAQLLLCLCLMLFNAVFQSATAQAQNPNLSNKREKIITLSADTIQLDSLSLIPNTLKLFATQNDSAQQQQIDEKAVFIDYPKSRIAVLDSSLIGKELKIEYRVFPFSFHKTYSHKKIDKLRSQTMDVYEPYIYQPSAPGQDIFGGSGGLTRRGSFQRGISVGNNQDLVVNSLMDIQLSGKLSDEIDILASLNDRNIPFQPEGTTAQLQEFDKIFVQITHPKHKVLLGDFQLINQPESYFMRINKKVQGVSFETKWNSGALANDSGLTGITATLSRGKWHRQTFNGAEGNQGPYRLRGSEGELFVIIISGTEKVYVNGELMKRGDQNDYRIDYNTGELSFTPNRLITKFDRIVIEFQYADRNYQRSILHGFTTYKVNDWDFSFNAYRERDNENRPLFMTLDSTERNILREVGDSLQDALAPSGKLVEYSKDRILYKKIDTAGFADVYVFSTNPDSAQYQVTFNYTGPGRGNYRQAKALANGKVYEWVQPVAGIPQGDYEPVLKLIAPQQQQMFTFGAKRKIKKGSVGVEGALSNRDINVFSAKNNNDNTGWSAKTFIQQEYPLQKKELPLRLNLRMDYEHKNKDFTPIERYRTVEFNRIWNRQVENPDENTRTQEKAEENLAQIQASLLKSNKINITNTNTVFTRGNYFNGLMENLNLRFVLGKYLLLSGTEFTWVNDNRKQQELQRQRFDKYFGDFSRSFKILRIGVGGVREQSFFPKSGLDYLLDNNSFRYETARAYLNSENSENHDYGIEVNQRNDYRPDLLDSTFNFSSRSREALFKYYYTGNVDKQFRLDFKYRNYKPTDTAGISNEENTFLTRLEYLLNFFKGAVGTSSYYELSTGRELKRDFVYVAVAKGQGTHIWNDYNENGIKEFNEFEITPFQDLGEYVRVIVPSNIYVNTLTNQYQQTVNLQPGKFFTEDTRSARFFKRFSNVTNLRVNNRLQEDPKFRYLNPYLGGIEDSVLISTSSLLRNIFYFNRTSPVWGADFTWNNTSNKSLLVSGFDSRQNKEYIFNLRVNVSPKLTLEPTYATGTKLFNSDYFSAKNFLIKHFRTGSQISWQTSQRLRLNINYLHSEQHNTLGDIKERSLQNEGGFETRYNWVGKAIASARITYIHINYKPGDALGTAIAYEILQGLRPGSNFTWNASWNQRLQNSLQLTFSYDGRKSESSKAVHVGRANVTWFF